MINECLQKGKLRDKRLCKNRHGFPYLLFSVILDRKLASDRLTVLQFFANGKLALKLYKENNIGETILIKSRAISCVAYRAKTRENKAHDRFFERIFFKVINYEYMNIDLYSDFGQTINLERQMLESGSEIDWGIIYD